MCVNLSKKNKSMLKIYTLIEEMTQKINIIFNILLTVTLLIKHNR